MSRANPTPMILPLLSFFLCLGHHATAGPPVVDPALAEGPVEVMLFEDLPKGTELRPTDLAPVENYRESALAFVALPTKYSANALPLDRSTPFVLRATLQRALPPGTYQFRLRARGAARLEVDGQALLSTQPQKANTSGDDPVPPPVQRDGSPLRPAPYPHQDATAELALDGKPHRFVLTAVIGGKGLVPSPGELSVSFAPTGQAPRLLGSEDAPLLTDEDWEAYAARQVQRQQRAEVLRRQRLSAAVVAKWDAYHREIRDQLAKASFPPPPQVTSSPVINAIDRYVGARLESAKTPAPPLVSDLAFLRRLSLDSVGVIPSVDEIRQFLSDPTEQRRQKAVDRLLSDPRWADHWVSYWQDVLAENPGFLKPDLNNSGPFRWWLHQSFSDGLPFDRIVAELILMEGSALQGAPAAFAKATLNDAPMAAKADILSQAFLGERLSCARCHDAPFDVWTQKDLFGLAAMLEGKPLKLPPSSTVPLVDGFRKPHVEVTLAPGQSISPNWPFASLISTPLDKIPTTSGVASRLEVARLIISPANKRFAQVVANRLWKRYVGVGIVEPCEDWSNGRISHPELLDYLARELVLSGYDLKTLARLIFTSHLYQRESVHSEWSKRTDGLFPAPVRRRLSAEQLVDSLHLAVGKDFGCEELNLNPAGNRPLTEFLNLGTPRRAWEFTALSNERDRPALALPVAQSLVDVLSAYGWRQSRQTPLTVREDAPSPMQSLLLANGAMGTRIVRLSDASALTELAINCQSLPAMLDETFLRILGRSPSEREREIGHSLLDPVFADRRTGTTSEKRRGSVSDRRVSWANHLSSEATVIRMEEERRLRIGEAPTGRLSVEFRERYEDLIWSLVNSPEFILVP